MPKPQATRMNPERRWTIIARNMLVGRTIKRVRYLTEAEIHDTLGWDRKAVVLELDDGNIIYPSADDEGNGPGALFTNDDANPVLPVI